MSKAPWIALYPSDYLADTAHLGLTEHGVYWRLLLHYYQHHNPLPADLDKICRIVLANTPEERRTVEYILTEFFVLTAREDGTMIWRHGRADVEIKTAKERHDLAARRASAGGQATKTKWEGLKQGLKPSSSIASRVVSTSTSTSTEKEKEKDTRGKRAVVCPPEVTEAVWRDFMAIRKAKRAPITPTALAGIQREAAKAHLTLEQALEHCCERGWQGFKADWLTPGRGETPSVQVGTAAEGDW